jgi:acyl-CoA thioester hydrolase
VRTATADTRPRMSDAIVVPPAGLARHGGPGPATMRAMGRFVHEVHMRWSDMDAYRHINNSAYLAYLEQARVIMFFHRHEGFSSGTVIARHEIDYLRPVVYHPDPLRVEMWVEKVRGAQFTVRYEVFDQDRLAARASTICVTFDFDRDRPRRLTDEERTILAGFADEAAEADEADEADGAAQAAEADRAER